jgi:glycosyltransferase involved in cell wall biosynthesis
MKKKIVYIIFKIQKSDEFQWLIEGLDHDEFELSFINIGINDSSSIEECCKKNNVSYYSVNYTSKKQLPSAIYKTYKTLKKIKPFAVHAHLFEGGLIGITSSWFARIKNRIYTRHYSDYHHYLYPKAVKYDHWINNRSTSIIAVSDIVKNILVDKENVPTEKVKVIEHGLKPSHFQNIYEDRVIQLMARHNIPSDKKIIGVVSRYTKIKGVQYIIPAFKKLIQKDKHLHLVLANANGDYKGEIQNFLQELPDNTYTEIEFENDNGALFSVFDAFVHVPVSSTVEAFGLVYLESMMSKVPGVFTKSGIGNDILIDNKNCCIVNYCDSEEIENALLKLLNDKSLKILIQENSLETAKSFTFDKKLNKIQDLYFSLK